MSPGKEKLLEFEKEGKWLFHGSSKPLERLDPRQAYTSIKGIRKEDGDPAVFATPHIDIAILKSLIHPENFPAGFGCSYNGKGGKLTFRASQKTLDQVKKDMRGYVHILSKDDFIKRNDYENYSLDSVKPQEIVEITGEDFPENVSNDYRG